MQKDKTGRPLEMREPDTASDGRAAGVGNAGSEVGGWRWRGGGSLCRGASQTEVFHLYVSGGSGSGHRVGCICLPREKGGEKGRRERRKEGFEGRKEWILMFFYCIDH